MLRLLVFLAGIACCGCSLLPQIVHQPTLHNPFPQLSKIAVVPFFNLSSEPTVDGRQFAMAYYNELQLVPGFEVVPMGVVERTIKDAQIPLAGPQDARRLAQMLGVDAVVIGAVTDFSPYYPPRCAMQIEWYSANPSFQPIPPGYGLPWGTPEEKDIPAPLVFEAEFAMAKEQLKTESPVSPVAGVDTSPPPTRSGSTPAEANSLEGDAGTAVAGGTSFCDQGGIPQGLAGIQGSAPPTCWPSDAPVLRHTRTYNGHDEQFTRALANYYDFRDDARFGGWQSYLQRSDDFVRFCCHMHLWEMLSARGGAGETRVVWRWPGVR